MRTLTDSRVQLYSATAATFSLSILSACVCLLSDGCDSRKWIPVNICLFTFAITPLTYFVISVNRKHSEFVETLKKSHDKEVGF